MRAFPVSLTRPSGTLSLGERGTIDCHGLAFSTGTETACSMLLSLSSCTNATTARLSNLISGVVVENGLVLAKSLRYDFEIALQVGKVERDFDLAGAVFQFLAVGASRQSPDDVVMESKLVAADIADRFLGQGQAKNRLGLSFVRFLVARPYSLAIGFSIAVLGDSGRRDDLDLVAGPGGRQVDLGSLAPSRALSMISRYSAYFRLELPMGPPPPASLCPLKKVEGVPWTAEP